MTATYTFDIFSTLDGYGSHGPEGDCGGFWGKQGAELLDRRLASFDAKQRMAFGATAFRQFVEMVASSTETSDVRDPWVIRSTIHGAFVRGYDVTLVSDAHTTEDHSAWGAPPLDKVIAHTNLYWSHQTAPGRKAATVETKDVEFGHAP